MRHARQQNFQAAVNRLFQATKPAFLRRIAFEPAVWSKINPMRTEYIPFHGKRVCKQGQTARAFACTEGTREGTMGGAIGAIMADRDKQAAGAFPLNPKYFIIGEFS